MTDIKIELVKTAILASVFLILLLPYFIHQFPGIINADYASFGTGKSMVPTIKTGDLVTVKAVGISDIKIGDILAVRLRGLRIVHRVVEIIAGETPRLRLKGDGNENPDGVLFDASHLMGKVVTIYPLRGLYTLSTGCIILLVAGVLLFINIWTSSKIDLNYVLLCLILSLSLADVIGHMLRVVT